MAASNIGTNSVGNTSGTGMTWNLSQTVTAGNVLIVWLIGSSVLAGATVTASGNSMTQFMTGGTGQGKMFKLENCPGSVTAVTVANVSPSMTLLGIAAEFNPTSTGDDAVGDTGFSFSASPWTSNSITTNNDDLMLIGLRKSASDTWTITSPYTMALQQSGAISAGLGWGEKTVAGTYTCDGTASAPISDRVIFGALTVGPAVDNSITGYSRTAQQAALVSFGD